MKSKHVFFWLGTNILPLQKLGDLSLCDDHVVLESGSVVLLQVLEGKVPPFDLQGASRFVGVAVAVLGTGNTG